MSKPGLTPITADAPARMIRCNSRQQTIRTAVHPNSNHKLKGYLRAGLAGSRLILFVAKGPIRVVHNGRALPSYMNVIGFGPRM
jgi:hypothetical protein